MKIRLRQEIVSVDNVNRTEREIKTFFIFLGINKNNEKIILIWKSRYQAQKLKELFKK